MTTITQGATTITPNLVLGYEAQSESRNVFHIILSAPSMDVSLAPAGMRSGELEMFFLRQEDAWAAHALHIGLGSFVLVDSDLPEINMTYVCDGSIKIALDDKTQKRWTLSVPFREVTP